MGLVASGMLRPDEAEYMDVTLRGEVTYEVFVHPDEPGVDFDLRIFDERGNLIEQDTDIDSDAVCVDREPPEGDLEGAVDKRDVGPVGAF